MNVIMTAMAALPAKNRETPRCALRYSSRPPSGIIFKFPVHYFTLSVEADPTETTQVALKEIFNKLTN